MRSWPSRHLGSVSCAPGVLVAVLTFCPFLTTLFNHAKIQTKHVWDSCYSLFVPFDPQYRNHPSLLAEIGIPLVLIGYVLLANHKHAIKITAASRNHRSSLY